MTAQVTVQRGPRAKITQLLLVLLAGLVGLMTVSMASAAQAATTDQAVPDATSIETEADLRRYVEANTDQMLEKMNQLRDQYATTDDGFYREMETELTDFIDFRRIAARVMARYGRQASEAQRDAFVEKFKRSLFDAYSRALANTSDFEIRVDDARFLAQNKNRATVNLTVISGSGEPYSVSYSLFENNDGRWMMENVIVEGVNIGLAFRDRFQQEMEQRRGDIQAVIDNWSGEVEELEEQTDDGGQGDSTPDQASLTRAVNARG